MNKQITFDDYIQNIQEKYARQCRHAPFTEYCHIHGKYIKDIQCPCEHYEIEMRCQKDCKHYRRDGYDKECFHCKRYNYNADVMTKDIPDRYER